METQESLKEPVDELRGTLRSLSKRLKRQEKVTETLGAAVVSEDVAALQGALAGMDDELLDRLGLTERAAALADQARGRLSVLHADQRRALAHGLGSACDAGGRVFRKLTENPPEFLVAPFTVQIDLDTMEATLCYARQELRTVAARPDDILAAAKKSEEEFATRQEGPEQLFERLFAAYRAVLGRQRKTIGQRVELSDILPQLALARQGQRFLEDPRRESFASYPKARFLFDLSRLCAARLLEHRNLRLDLGTATGDSVRKKNRVFYIQGANGEGQYYLSLRFVTLEQGAS